MPRQMTAEKLAKEICEQEGFEYTDIIDFSEDMLIRKLAGEVIGGDKNKTPEQIVAEKLRLRHWYILLAEQMPNKYNNLTVIPIPKEYGDRGKFIWELVRTGWFDGKTYMVLDQIETMLDGSVSDTPYDPETDRHMEGKLVRTILAESFFLGKKNKLTKKAFAAKLDIHETTFDKKRDAGMATIFCFRS